MHSRPLLFALTLLANPGTASAQDGPQPPLPAPTQAALEVFRSQGTTAGIRALTPNWDNESDRAKQDQLIEAFDKLTPYAGKFTGYDVVRSATITPHLRRYYILMLFENQPVYLMMGLYQIADTPWRVITFNFNTDSKQVFPASIMEPETRPQRP